MPSAKKVLIIQNVAHESSGLFGEFLNVWKVPKDVIVLQPGRSFPPLDLYAALIVMGGPDSANDTNEKMKTEVAKVHLAISQNMPYLGICLGLQVMVKAAGGNVVKSPVREIGFRDLEGEWYEVMLTAEGKADPIFEDVPARFKIFHLHGETVELGDGMSLLGTGKDCRNQIVRIGRRAYGFQGHLELTEEMFGTWLVQDPDLRKKDANPLRRDFQFVHPECLETAKLVFLNFLKIAEILL